MRFTKAQLDKLQERGMIRGYHMTETRKGKQLLLQKKGKQHYWIEMNLQAWCEARSVELAREFQFHPSRKFRFDWCIPALKIGIEYEGIFSTKSRHTTFDGYSRDAEKYNLAAAAGWKVLRYTAKNYKNMFIDIDSKFQ